MGFFDKLKSGLSKTKASIDDKINGVFSTFRKVKEAEEVKVLLREEIQNILEVCDNSLKLETTPSVILVIGVNGVRKDNFNSEKLQIDFKKTEKR